MAQAAGTGRRAAGVALALALAGWPLAGWAADRVIQIEARRGPAALAQALAGWAARFPDVVTYPLPRGFTAIALGPMPEDAAAARLAALKAAGAIPADSLLWPVPRGMAAVAPAAPQSDAAPAPAAPAPAVPDPAVPDPAVPAPAAPELAVPAPAVPAPAAPEPAVPEPAAPAPEAPGPSAPAVTQALPLLVLPTAAPEVAAAPHADRPTESAAPAPAPPAVPAPGRRQALPALALPRLALPTAPPAVSAPAASETAAPVPAGPAGAVLIIETVETRAEGEAALDRWRPVIAGARLYPRAQGGLAVAVGTADRPTAEAWRAALVGAGTLPDSATVADAAALDAPLAGASGVALPALPPVPAPLPAVADRQRLLAWAGHYTGPIDGADGPATQAALAAEIAASRVSADPGTALAALAGRRAGWAAEMGLGPLVDAATGLTVTAPLARLTPVEVRGGLSIHGPKAGSGAALILFARPGGAAALDELANLITALGWAPGADRQGGRDRWTMTGSDGVHRGHAEGRLDGDIAQGFVLIWPEGDAENQPRILAELRASLARHAPPATILPPDGPGAPLPLPAD